MFSFDLDYFCTLPDGEEIDADDLRCECPLCAGEVYLYTNARFVDEPERDEFLTAGDEFIVDSEN